MSSSSPRVAITGIGVVSPFGVGRECFWHHISRGISGTRRITEFEPKFACRVAASVPDDCLARAGADGVDLADEAAFVANGGRADLRRYAKVSRIAVLAATEALRDAGLQAAGLGAVQLPRIRFEEQRPCPRTCVMRRGLPDA
jgi:3-oxoacyl-[acyl-carrier-protein] synthase II